MATSNPPPRSTEELARPTAYWDYIRVPELTSLQGGLEDDESSLGNDEVLFITVHQIFELWFKLILRELRSARDLFQRPVVAEQELSSAVHGLRRITTLLERCTDHWPVVESLNTREYLAFRDKLMPASGFQSYQVRQVEILFGLEEGDRVKLGAEGSYKDLLQSPDGGDSIALEKVRAQLADLPTLKQAVDEWLWRTPIDGVGPEDADSEASLDRFVESYLAAHRAELDRSCAIAVERAAVDADRERLVATYAKEAASVRAFLEPTEAEGGARRRRTRAAMLFIETYRELPLLAWPREILAGLIEVEQRFVVFRQRHARMVERVIGRRTGTGGSSGVDYLDRTAHEYRIFRDLWAIRTLQIRREASPQLEHPEYYDFAQV